MTQYILELEEFGVAFGEKIILSSVDLKVPVKGNVVLFGPAGIGKSTLLRSICGINYSNPSFRTWGKASFAGDEINNKHINGDQQEIVIVSQNAKLMMSTVFENIVSGLPERRSLRQNQQVDLVKRILEQAGLPELTDKLDESVINLPLGQQRHIAIIRTAVSNPKLLCIDEPTTGIDEEHIAPLLKYISNEAKKRAIITILHNQDHAKQLEGIVALLSSGWINECESDKTFYTEPKSKAGKQFVKTGSCLAVDPESVEEDLVFLDQDAIDLPPPIPEAAKDFVSDAFGPRNFLWLKKGMLAGTPQPGLVNEIEYDLMLLKKVGITKLISLRELEPDAEVIKNYDIESLWFPMKDMTAPPIKEAKKWCKKVAKMLQQNEIVAFHCKAGLGRTGTLLVAQLIWEGMDALKALEKARQIEPRWVQSEKQVKFIEAFDKSVKKEQQKTSS